MKKLYIYVSVILTLAGATQLAKAADRAGGGGDICEDRIKVIRDDISQWINNGGPKGLILPQKISLAQYSQSMLKQISLAKVKCVGMGDPGFPVTVQGTPKVCRFDRDNLGSRITCDFMKFNSTDESDQYVLIHHEYVGLSGIETPNGADSDYSVSNQISGYLVDQVVKKLAVNPTINLVDPTPYTTGASNVIVSSSGAATFYFSSITTNLDAFAPPNFIADGSPCSKAINPLCRNAGDPFVLTVKTGSSVSKSGILYLLNCPNGSVPSGIIPGSCNLISFAPIGNDTLHKTTVLTTTWGSICASLSGTYADLSAACVSATGSNINFRLYLVADPDSSGLVSSAVLSLNFWITSSIPSAALNGTSGLYDFTTSSAKSAVGFPQFKVDTGFPIIENGGVGIQYGRFYYVMNPQGPQTYDPTQFANISLMANSSLVAHSQFYIDEDGIVHLPSISGLQSGKRYYFRAALVDNAGNVGYLTSDTDSVQHTAIPR